jgi:DNA-binding GntR family transcriptional regulator
MYPKPYEWRDMAVIEPPKSISDQIYEHLKAQILYGEIRPGERLTQERMAEKLEVSRMPVREAFRLLEQDGLVERLPQSGFRVTSITMESIRQIYGIRGALEAYAIELACDQISEETIAKLEDIKRKAHDVLNQNALDQSEKVRRFIALNTEFHDTIYEATENPYLIKIILQLRNLVVRMRAIGLRKESKWKEIWDEHDQLLGSLKKKDKETASRCIRRHIENAFSYITSVVQDDGIQ